MKKINRNQIIIIIVAVVVGLLLGKLFFSGSHSEHNHEHHSHENTKETIWTCSMHPDIRQHEFGLCPLCGMDLIPLEDDDDSADDLTIKMSETAMKLANIHTAKIQKGDVKREIKLNGKIEADERLINSQSSHISGRIESLNINFTGEYVQKGKTIATIYSPELVTAQKELLETFKTKDDNEELFQATKQKLKRWKLSEKAINNIIETNNIVEIFPISADVSGYITKKNVNLGDYINRGDALFEIAELSRVWVLFDLYEDDMQWVKTGDEIKYNVKSLPGEIFSGKVTYIDPIIDPTTRIAKVRVEQENENQLLKPEMYVSGIVESSLNKYQENLSVPHSAVLWTGKRSIVYVKVESENRVAFQLREVVLGPSLGDSYTIIEGLEEGEEIAVNGTFSIDAAAQLAGKYSMMSYENMAKDDSNGLSQFELHPEHTVSIPAKAEKVFLKVVEDYYKFKDALVNDDLKSAQKFGEVLSNSVKKTDMKLFTGDSHNVWMNFYSVALENLEHIHHFDDIATIRKHFNPISHTLILTLNSFEMQSTTPIYIQYCPMVDDDTGAYWVSGEENVLNPYFGSMMLRCGEVTEVLNRN